MSGLKKYTKVENEYTLDDRYSGFSISWKSEEKCTESTDAEAKKTFRLNMICNSV